MRTRTLLLSLLLLMATGCITGAGRARTTSVHTFNDGVHPEWKETIEQTYEGSSTGMMLPLVYGTNPQTGMPYGQGNVMTTAQGSPVCAHDPSRCASNVTVYMPQSGVLVTNGYGYGGRSRTVGAGSPPAYGEPTETVDIAELQERLHEVESKLADVEPGLAESLRLHCQLILDHPEMVKDETQRAQLVQSCTEALAE